MYVSKTKALISCAADMQPCFPICKKKFFFHDTAHYVIVVGFNPPDKVHMVTYARGHVS